MMTTLFYRMNLITLLRLSITVKPTRRILPGPASSATGLRGVTLLHYTLNIPLEVRCNDVELGEIGLDQQLVYHTCRFYACQFGI